MKKKFNSELLKEELKKFKMISEYSFYTGENDLTKHKDDLILGDLDEADDAPDDLEPTDDTNTDDAANSVASDLGVDGDKGDDNGDMSGDIGDTSSDDVETAPEVAPEVPAEPASDEVEVDVTSLVKGSEEAKAAADLASQNTTQLLQKFSELEGRVAAMDNITHKIDHLEKEMVKRNPTPVEKLEMRSLNSFPYSLKLTDYWNEKEGPYDVTGQDKKDKEYILTKDDVDAGYSDSNIKQSLSSKPNEMNTFEEEDI